MLEVYGHYDQAQFGYLDWECLSVHSFLGDYGIKEECQEGWLIPVKSLGVWIDVRHPDPSKEMLNLFPFTTV
jgi:hypothetical protein